jgi:hypothetical protein
MGDGSQVARQASTLLLDYTPQQVASTLRTLANYLTLNPRTVEARAVGPMAAVLARFPAHDVRSALASCAHERGEVQVDRVLRVIADRMFEALGLPPPVDVAVGEIWRAISDGPRARPWSHEAIRRAVNRYGWDDLVGQEAETASVRKAQVRRVYEDERERVVSGWIADVCEAAERAVADGVVRLEG